MVKIRHLQSHLSKRNHSYRSCLECILKCFPPISRAPKWRGRVFLNGSTSSRFHITRPIRATEIVVLICCTLLWVYPITCLCGMLHSYNSNEFLVVQYSLPKPGTDVEPSTIQQLRNQNKEFGPSAIRPKYSRSTTAEICSSYYIVIKHRMAHKLYMFIACLHFLLVVRC